VPDTISIGGPVEEIDGQFILRIPLEAGGRELASYARGISEVRDGFLVVFIPDWLATKLRLFPGSNVIVDNEGGRFNIRGTDPAI
jgi:hypothetical protein